MVSPSILRALAVALWKARATYREVAEFVQRLERERNMQVSKLVAVDVQLHLIRVSRPLRTLAALPAHVCLDLNMF